MRLAVVTPLDPRTTGVADYSRDLLPHLFHVVGQIEVFTAAADLAFAPRTVEWQYHAIEQLPANADRFDLIIYQMGNSSAHDFMAPYLLAYPGLLVLHDLSLHFFFVRQIQAGCPAWYWRALSFAYGLAGTAFGRRYLRGETREAAYPQYLLSEWLAARSPGVIVHSEHAAALLRERCPAANVAHVPMPMPLPPSLSKVEAKRRIAVAEEKYLIVVFGVLNQSKQPLVILEAVQQLIAAGIDLQVVFIGVENSEFHLFPEVERRGLDAHVKQLDFVEDLTLVNTWLMAADVAISLRAPYWGETPSSTLRALAVGTPAIVNAVGAFNELPDAACIKLAPDDSDPALALSQALRTLHDQPQRRLNMAEAARRYVADMHDPARVARRYRAMATALVNRYVIPDC
jgi:glycosyltransferase involved in cell wall biosynthesis